MLGLVCENESILYRLVKHAHLVMTQGGLVRIRAWWLGYDEAHLLRLLVDTNGPKLDTRLFVFLPLLNQFFRDLQETVSSALVNNMQLATQRRKEEHIGLQEEEICSRDECIREMRTFNDQVCDRRPSCSFSFGSCCSLSSSISSRSGLNSPGERASSTSMAV